MTQWKKNNLFIITVMGGNFDAMEDLKNGHLELVRRKKSKI